MLREREGMEHLKKKKKDNLKKAQGRLLGCWPGSVFHLGACYLDVFAL